VKIIQLFFIICLTGFLFNSCGRYPCGNASSFIGLINFTESESDTIIIRRFIKGADFTALQDSMVITQFNAHLQRQHDTLLILFPFDGNEIITSHYDFEIVLPGINRVYKLTDITEDIRYGSKAGAKVYCINPITSYKLDGELIKVRPYYQPIYLMK
jgi:hypothetical protein